MQRDRSQRPSSPILAALAAVGMVVLACGGGHADGPLEVNAPPPAPDPVVSDWSPEGELVCEDDFTSFADWAAFAAGTTCISNVPSIGAQDRMDIDVRGLRYLYDARPNRCNDHFVGIPAHVGLPPGTHEVWLEWTGIFSSNWTTVNAGCASPAPDFKYVLVWSQKENVACGTPRADFKMGQGTNGGTIVASTIGFASCDEVPVNHDGTTGTVKAPGATAYFDGQAHLYRVVFKILEDGWYEVFASIDDQVTHQYVTRSVEDDDLRWDKIVLGANRNLGAVEDMQLWWRNLKVWAR